MKNTSQYLVRVSAIVTISDEEQLDHLHLCLIKEDTYGIETVTVVERGEENHFVIEEYSNLIRDDEWLTAQLLGFWDENDEYFVEGAEDEI